MRPFLVLCGLSIVSLPLFAQPSKIYTSDIDNFWQAYDSVKTTTDTSRQRHFIQTLYMDKASPGLQSFIKARDHSARRHLDNINAFPKFWQSIRPNTLAIKNNIPQFEKAIRNFKKRYKHFRQPNLYFTIGCLNSGGTTDREKLLIGAEIATANAQTNATELNPWLQNVFKDLNGVLFLVVHEMVHTQQADDVQNGTLLARSIMEGAADFIAELLLEQPLTTPYARYGNAHEKELWQKFQQEMNGTDLQHWLYNGNNAPGGNADLGYYMGYVICKAYYQNSGNKRKALKEIIQLNYLDNKAVSAFLEKSGYANKWQ